MQKRLISLICILFSTAVTASPIASNPVKSTSSMATTNDLCTQLKAKLMTSRQKIQQAFATGNACVLGNTVIQNHKLIQANLQCFPKYAKGEYNLFKMFDKADTSLISVPASCDKPRSIVTGNDQQVKQALMKQDGCTAGKIELQSYKIIQANLGCFPRAVANPDNMFKALDTINANASAAQ